MFKQTLVITAACGFWLAGGAVAQVTNAPTAPMVPGSTTMGAMPTNQQNNTSTSAATAAAVPEQKRESIRDHLDEARTVYNTGNQIEAAKHVNKAIALLRTEAGREQGDVQDNLRDAIKRLGDLATKLEKQEVKSADEFRDAYSDTYQKLAWHHYQRAERAYQARADKATRNRQRQSERDNAEVRMQEREDERERVARDTNDNDSSTTESWMGNVRENLSESSENFGAWAKETGTDVKENTGGVRNRIKTWAGKAISGTGAVTENVGETLNNWGDELRQYGHGVEKRARTEMTTDSTKTTHTDERDSLREERREDAEHNNQ